MTARNRTNIYVYHINVYPERETNPEPTAQRYYQLSWTELRGQSIARRSVDMAHLVLYKQLTALMQQLKITARSSCSSTFVSSSGTTIRVSHLFWQINKSRIPYVGLFPTFGLKTIERCFNPGLGREDCLKLLRSMRILFHLKPYLPK